VVELAFSPLIAQTLVQSAHVWLVLVGSEQMVKRPDLALNELRTQRSSHLQHLVGYGAGLVNLALGHQDADQHQLR
jgi:hypothetical protein